MSGGTALDLRWPIGGLFTALGLLLAGYGLLTAGSSADYARAASVNINLWWGLVMLVFGLVLLAERPAHGPELLLRESRPQPRRPCRGGARAAAGAGTGQEVVDWFQRK